MGFLGDAVTAVVIMMMIMMMLRHWRFGSSQLASQPVKFAPRGPGSRALCLCSEHKPTLEFAFAFAFRPSLCLEHMESPFPTAGPPRCAADSCKPGKTESSSGESTTADRLDGSPSPFQHRFGGRSAVIWPV